MFVYESAPISAVTGTITFSESVTGIPMAVWDIVRTNKCFSRNLTGISLPALEAYTGKHTVTALRVLDSKRFDKPVKFGPRPPQNWGKYLLPRGAAAAAESEMPND
jgi:predicted transcriptional regulator